MAGHLIPQKEPHNFELGTDDLHIWSIATQDDHLPEDLAYFEASLSPQETERYQRLKIPHVRQNFLLSRACLRYLLSFYIGLNPGELEFSLGEYGKPELGTPGIQPSLQFNLTHTEGRIAIALHHHRTVGIDIEQLRPVTNLDRMCNHCLTPEETQTVLPLQDASACHRFLQYWTTKEALLKAKGVGLNQPMNQFEVLLAKDSLTPQPVQVQMGKFLESVKNQNLENFHLYQWQPETDYVAALAVQQLPGDSSVKISLKQISPRELVQLKT